LIDGEIVGSTLLARPYLLDDIVMVAETLVLIYLVRQLLAPVFPSFVSCDLQPFDCLMGIVPSGVVWFHTPAGFDWAIILWWYFDDCCVPLMQSRAIPSNLPVAPL
jgi:hypothetical protein